MGDVFEFLTPDLGETWRVGQINDPGATEADVLTVQADGSIAAAPAGGTQSVKAVRAAFVFNSANILTGRTIYTPTAGDVIVGLASGISVTTAFDGTTPNISVISQGGVPSDGNFLINKDARDVNASQDQGTPNTHVSVVVLGIGTTVQESLYYCEDATPIQVFLGDNNGGDPGSTQGVGEIILLIIPAA